MADSAEITAAMATAAATPPAAVDTAAVAAEPEAGLETAAAGAALDMAPTDLGPAVTIVEQAAALAAAAVATVPVMEQRVPERGVGLAVPVRERAEVPAVVETGLALAAKVRALDLVPDAAAAVSRQAEEKERGKADMAAVPDITETSRRE